MAAIGSTFPSQPNDKSAKSFCQARGFLNTEDRILNTKPSSDLFEIAHEDDDLLVINKPAGLVCHPTKTDEYSSLVGRIRLYLGQERHFHLVNRLDRETSGLTFVAKTDDFARALRRHWENRQVEKSYLAIVQGFVERAEGVIDACLGKDEKTKVAIKDCVRPDGAPAFTRFRVLKHFFKSSTEQGSAAPETEFSLLNVRLETGRKHQIRIHLAYIGHPIVGDKLYGYDEDCYLALVENRLTAAQQRCLMLPFHALHASDVCFTLNGIERRFHAEPEQWFKEFIT
jgi:23S rRNA pseudouridine1911/1915/1917 synthase